MALFRWRGATSTVWALGTNWVDGAGAAYLGARYPGSIGATFDDVLFDDSITNSVAAYDAVAGGDEELLSFKVGADYNGTIADGGQLKFQCNQATSSVIIDGQSALQMNLDISTTPEIIVLASNTGIDIDGTVTSCYLYKGTITLNATLTIATNFRVGYLSSQNSDVAATIAVGTTLPATIQAYGGTVTNNVALTTINIDGSQWTQAAGNITTANINSGKLLWNGGTLTTANVTGSGELTAANETNPRTVTTINAYAQAIINLNNGVGGITLGTGLNILSTDVSITFPPNSTVTYT